MLYFSIYRQEKLWVQSIWCRSIHIRKWNIYEILSRVRLEECERKFHAKRSEAENFLKKYNKCSKIHCFALKLYTGASKSGDQGGAWAPGPPGPPPDPLVRSTRYAAVGMPLAFTQEDFFAATLNWVWITNCISLWLCITRWLSTNYLLHVHVLVTSNV